MAIQVGGAREGQLFWFAKLTSELLENCQKENFNLFMQNKIGGLSNETNNTKNLM